jgi:hypothetical protein
MSPLTRQILIEAKIPGINVVKKIAAYVLCAIHFSHSFSGFGDI